MRDLQNISRKKEKIMDEKRKIIDMIANGKISADEGAKLLFALNRKPKNFRTGKRIVFQIIQEGKSKPKVNIAIPIKLAKIGMHFIPKEAKINASLGSSKFDLSSIDWKEIIEMASAGEIGDLFYLEIEEEDETPTTIRIFVE